MKLFGEYLVEKKIIGEDVLAQALVSQIKVLPSIAEVVFENKLLKVRQFLDVIRQQNHRQCGFVEAASDLNLWQQDLSKEVDRKIQECRIPLGEVLVKLGTVKMEQITRALDEFFGEGIHLKPDPAIVAAAPLMAPPSASESLTPSNGEAQSEASPYGTYCDLLKSDFKDRAINAVNEVVASGNKDTVKVIIEEFRHLKGAARLVGAEHSEKLLVKIEDIFCEIVKRKTSEFGTELKEKLPKAASDTMEFIGLLKNTLSQGNPESSILSVAKNDQALKEIVGCLDVLKFDFSFLSSEV